MLLPSALRRRLLPSGGGCPWAARCLACFSWQPSQRNGASQGGREGWPDSQGWAGTQSPKLSQGLAGSKA